MSSAAAGGDDDTRACLSRYSQRRGSDALAKIDTFLDTLSSVAQSPVRHPAAAAVSAIPTTGNDMGTHVDMHHELGIDILVNVFSDFEGSDVTAYSSATQREEEKKQLMLLRQSLARRTSKAAAAADKPNTASSSSPSKHDLLADCYGVKGPQKPTKGQTRRQLYARKTSAAESTFNLGKLMEVETEHRLQELFSATCAYNSVMNKKQVHALSICLVDHELRQDNTLEMDKMARIAATEQALLQKDETLTFAAFQQRMLKLNAGKRAAHTEQVAWIDDVYQNILDSAVAAAVDPPSVLDELESPRKQHKTSPIKARGKTAIAHAKPAIDTGHDGQTNTQHPKEVAHLTRDSHKASDHDTSMPHEKRKIAVMRTTANEIVTPMIDTAHDPTRAGASVADEDALDELDHTLHLTARQRVHRDSVDLTHAKRQGKEQQTRTAAAIVYDSAKSPNLRSKIQECKVMMLSLSNLNFANNVKK
ncbi:Aste57867_22239 [Aphanomyces stellatus]|uniref:Aste57867_22239 protein n=1 Tax=Aphanomyces stellatus TaxID=120398 RepID=A0A485LPK1_9STRA|nr:hypothetical protein As57867_022170 [Aphanomyces stellatus]VFT98906.1 Aste57867_22239 [Aphanomyces stellatus]